MRAAALLVLLPGMVLAQGVPPASGPTPCGVTQSCAAVSYEATATSGSGLACNALLASCLDLGPGADNEIGTNVSGQILLGPTTSTTCQVKMGANLLFKCNGEALVNGPLNQYSSAGYFVNETGGAVKVDDAQGLNVEEKALHTCNAGSEGDILRDNAAGATSGARTRICICTSDGAATPSHVWQNLVTGTTGSATTCAP
jgi:hypothetical protein